MEDSSALAPLEAYSAGLRQSHHLLEISNLAYWSVASAKPNKGVAQLRDESPTLFWESDGAPVLDIHFSKRVALCRVSIFSHYELDESYTPSVLLVLGGTGEHDLVEMARVDIHEPRGWHHIDVHVRVFWVRVVVVANHQNGKDTHLRGVRLYAPPGETRAGASPSAPTAETERGHMVTPGLASKTGVDLSPFGGLGGLEGVCWR